jgi:hypothetical protein
MSIKKLSYDHEDEASILFNKIKREKEDILEIKKGILQEGVFFDTVIDYKRVSIMKKDGDILETDGS